MKKPCENHTHALGESKKKGKKKKNNSPRVGTTSVGCLTTRCRSSGRGSGRKVSTSLRNLPQKQKKKVETRVEGRDRDGLGGTFGTNKKKIYSVEYDISN